MLSAAKFLRPWTWRIQKEGCFTYNNQLKKSFNKIPNFDGWFLLLEDFPNISKSAINKVHVLSFILVLYNFYNFIYTMDTNLYKLFQCFIFFFI